MMQSEDNEKPIVCHERRGCDRSSTPHATTTLIAADDLARLLVELYDHFDAIGPSIVRLEHIYWPLA
jgi:hypothetical protein